MSRKPAPADSRSRSGAAGTPRPSGSTAPLVRGNERGWLAALVAVAAVYLLLYYGSDRPLGESPEPGVLGPRVSSLVFLFAPDRLLAIWCGGQLGNFSLLDRWPIIALVAVLLAAAAAAGGLALAGLGVLGWLTRLEQAAFALGVGLNLLSLYALAAGLAGWLGSRWVFVLPLPALAAAAGALVWFGRARGAAHGARSPAGERAGGDDDPRWNWWLVGAAPFALVSVLGGMLPPMAYDVREYHLQAPKEWFQNGRIDFLPHNIYANMPLGSELVSLWAMSLAGGDDGWWWGAIAGKTLMACYPLVAAAMLVALGRRIHSRAAGALAAVIFLSTPWIVELAKTGYNEGPVAMYAILAIAGLVLARIHAAECGRWRLVGLAGFCAGSAVACKYPPALFLVVPLAVWVAVEPWLERAWRAAACVLGERSTVRPIARAPEAPAGSPDMPSPASRWGSLVLAAVFLAAAGAGCGLWFGKNLVLTGNPTYPLLYSLFDGRTRTPEKDRQWTRVHSPQPDAAGRRFTLRDLGKQLAWIGWQTPWASLAALPLALFAWRVGATRRLVAALGLWILFVFAAWWLFTHRLDRFLMLLVPAVSLLAGLGVVAGRDRAWRGVALGLVGWAAVSQFLLVTLSSDNRFFAPLAALRRDDPELGYEGGRRLHPAHRWLNQHARPDERVLLVGDAEPFELQIQAVYNTCFDDCQFTRLFRGRTRQERAELLAAERIRYVFFHWPHLARYRSPGNYGYPSDYPTPKLVHDELVGEQRLLKKIDIGLPAELGELFEVQP